MKLASKHSSLIGRLIMLAIFAFGASMLGTQALQARTLAFAPDSVRHDLKKDAKAVRRDKRIQHALRKDIAKDKATLRNDLKSGNTTGAKADVKDLKKDVKNIRKVHRNLTKNRHELLKDKTGK
ncbi:MAG: hypothetical protein Q8922_07800 [Bacteroidota bacterium]|nr:hypothetical protein [Bacteroidota bacterium]MDP4233204.1 hypothetical protein [Bacteroidota bacterium]MDP4242177.1 hypothetical protein [Bacteroidota bacterium]MDP4287827.1 hypothetical protein [Bacteroidota bacterium]